MCFFKDPSSDFRGGGILSLYCLIFIVENHGERIHAILKEEREYPFAVAGINIVHELICSMLHLTHGIFIFFDFIYFN